MESPALQNHASDLIDFYSGGAIPARNLELIKDRIGRQVEKQKNAELKPYVGLRETLKELRTMHARRALQPAVYLTLGHPILRELLQLRPEDFLILLASHRYDIPDDELSVILDVSADHLRFRREQLRQSVASGKPEELQRICGAPVATINEEIQQSHHQRRNIAERFRSLPLPARFLFETGFVLGVLIFLMWLIPEVRNRYESSVQKRINDYMIESTISDAPAPDGTSKTPRIVEAPPPETNPVAEEPESKPSETQSKRPLKVNAGETWRFSFTGPATNDILTGINETLQKMGYAETKSITAPGGIQFDFFIPVKDLSNLKLNLEEMTAHLQRRTSSSTPDAPAVVNMSWYKKRGMTGRKVPAGNVEVVIWVSTL